MDITVKYISVTHRPARDDWPEKWTARFLPVGETEFLDADVEQPSMADGLGKLKWLDQVTVTVDRRLNSKAYQSYRFVLTGVTP